MFIIQLTVAHFEKHSTSKTFYYKKRCVLFKNFTDIYNINNYFF